MVVHTAHPRVIVVTGVTRKIGLAVVTQLAKAGHTLLLGTQAMRVANLLRKQTASSLMRMGHWLSGNLTL